MIHFEPLLADGEWFKLAAFGVAFVIYIINHLVSAARKSQQRQAPRPPVAAEAVPPARQQLNEELNDFLRRAGDKRQAAPPPSPPPAGSQFPAGAQRPPARPNPRKQKKSAPPVLEAQVVEEPLSKRKMKSSINTRSLEQRAQALAHLNRPEQAREPKAQHRVSYRAGSLASEAKQDVAVVESQASTPRAAAMSGASHLLELLASPQGVRDALVLGEILNRPEHRW